LFRKLDDAGPFALTTNGTLEKEAFMHFRHVVNQHVMLEFQEIKEKIFQQRIEALK
jgi:hypothetical protein